MWAHMGILTITIARKPVVGSVAQNVLKWQTGGININDSRVGSGEILKGGGGKLWSHYRDSTEDRAQPKVNPGLGRWPANVIFSHLSDCESMGELRVKGSPTSKKFHAAYDGDSTTGFLRGVSHPGNQHSDQDGMETVRNWKCEPGCPVNELDQQSGYSGSNWRSAKADGKSSLFGTGTKNPTDSPDDTGGASRFFKQVQED